MIEIKEIMSMLPHRFPFLMVDRVVEIELGKRIVGIKNVSIGEPYFAGHFPGVPVMPGVLMVEALAQCAGILYLKENPSEIGKPVFLVSIEEARFKKPIVPGDQIRLEVELVRVKGPFWKFCGKAVVDGVVAAEATFMAMIKG